MLQILIVSLIFIGLSVALMAVKLIMKPSSSFPETHVGGNREMQKRGISCHTSQHRAAQKHQTLFER